MTGGAPFARVLIANRGEIAVRIARACRELGVAPVAIYGEGEKASKHVAMCDDAYRVPACQTLPYLDIEAIVAIGKRAGAEAVHPGYGFLAENDAFAEAVETAGLVFIGPTPANMRAMGDKVQARRAALAAGVPITPGSDGPVRSVEEARAWAERFGFPVAIKAAGGGGGRGFRVARSEAELAEAFQGSAGEAQRYFADPTVYVERYLERPRHVEVQVFADTHGQVLALGERDCSVQRRHQKLIEETPSPAVRPEIRAGLCAAAAALARAVDYRGAGTCEFLLAQDGSFAFLEMNTRIQVEHTITEEVTGIDLVKEQMLVAAGRPLSFGAGQVQPRGHAIQCRINAEDAGRDFRPVPGVISRYRQPEGPGIRVDSAADDGAAILPAYDSLIAKLVAWGRDRDEAIARMRRALGEFEIDGVPTTIPFHANVMDSVAFRNGNVTTAFLAEHPEIIPPATETVPAAHHGAETAEEVVVEVENRRFTVRLPAGVGLDGVGERSRPVSAQRQRRGSAAAAGDDPGLMSPLQGKVLRVEVAAGDRVEQGQLLCVIEAMKMENEIVAHRGGTITELAVRPGDTVAIGSPIAAIRSEADDQAAVNSIAGSSSTPT